LKDDLEIGAKQLAALREKIDAERLPLAKQLDALEKTLLEARKEYEGVTRILDTRNLDISNLKTETKAKEDESFYISNLLDEFVRGFESKLHMAELPAVQVALEKAKAAAADAQLPVSEKFTAQIEPLRIGLKRSKETLGGMRLSGPALNEQGTVLPGSFALLGPFAMFASADRTSVGIVPPPMPGAVTPLVKPMDDKINAGIASVMEAGKGWFPLDPTNGNALKELLAKTSLIDTYKHGGPIMHPLLITSLIAFSVAIERMFFVLREKRRRRPDLVIEMLDCIEKDDPERAIKIGRTTKDYVAKTLLYAWEHREKSLGSALMLAANNELKRLGRGLPVLDTCITVAPLLGLLGTVTGMMHSFSLMGGDLGAPGAITGGISEALIATAAGLIIAIVALLPFNYLNARLDEARHQIEAAATRLELLMKNKAKAAAAAVEEEEGFKLAAPAAAGGGGAH
jgi:biopolymer transport protein ExbB